MNARRSRPSIRIRRRLRKKIEEQKVLEQPNGEIQQHPLQLSIRQEVSALKVGILQASLNFANDVETSQISNEEYEKKRAEMRDLLVQVRKTLRETPAVNAGTSLLTKSEDIDKAEKEMQAAKKIIEEKRKELSAIAELSPTQQENNERCRFAKLNDELQILEHAIQNGKELKHKKNESKNRAFIEARLCQNLFKPARTTEKKVGRTNAPRVGRSKTF